ncbi:hypothetical protein [Escherichia coli]|uniref:hypothetical protein n=1 Tax=Escherichia coli TaxID=562 RepID=UPI00351CF6B6
MTNYIQVTRISHEISGLVYCLDSPTTEEIRHSKSFLLKVSGWVLFDKKPVDVILQINGKESIHPCERIRNDVVSALNNNSEAQCGFLIPVVYPVDLKIGFIINGAAVWVASVKIKPTPKVLLGLEGYLFLDNDTNMSVDQYTGKTLMSDDSLSLWEEYFQKLSAYTNGKKSSYIFTLAPSKELILSQFYPYRKNSITPIEQFLIAFNKFKIFYPLDVLQKTGALSYSKIDTHWTDYGAAIVVNSMLGLLNIEPKEPFPFPFNVKRISGDLGSKVPQIITQDILKADYSSIDKYKVFDNKILNRGWIRVYENEKSLRKEKVIIFGDSFSTIMVPYLASIFNKVIAIVSGARIDYEILENENPDYIICELTTRFLIQSPDKNYSVSDDCLRKINNMAENERDTYINDIVQDTTDKYKFFLQKTLSDVSTGSTPA